MHPPGSYCTSWPQPETMRYSHEIPQWGTEVRILQDLIVLPDLSLKQWGTVMRYLNEVQRYASSRILSYFPTSAWNNEVQSWGTEVHILQDLIVLPNLSLKQWGTVMRYRGTRPPGSYRTSRPQPETIRYINKVQRYASSRILLYFPTSAWNNEVVMR